MNEENQKSCFSPTGLAPDICIWQDEATCEDCGLDTHLFCTSGSKYRLLFGLPFIAVIIPVIIGLVLARFSLPAKIIMIAGWLGYMFFFLNVWESRMLCNHCPWYADDSQKVLHCPIDFGKLKTGKYVPGPLRPMHKVQFIIGALILLAAPLVFLAAAGQWIWLGAACAGAVFWIVITQTRVCTACINFSCPLNRVPKELRDKFLRKNPVICRAWEEAGYSVSDAGTG